MGTAFLDLKTVLYAAYLRLMQNKNDFAKQPQIRSCKTAISLSFFEWSSEAGMTPLT